jgi:hypothetical protein
MVRVIKGMYALVPRSIVNSCFVVNSQSPIVATWNKSGCTWLYGEVENNSCNGDKACPERRSTFIAQSSCNCDRCECVLAHSPCSFVVLWFSHFYKVVLVSLNHSLDHHHTLVLFLFLLEAATVLLQTSKRSTTISPSLPMVQRLTAVANSSLCLS